MHSLIRLTQWTYSHTQARMHTPTCTTTPTHTDAHAHACTQYALYTAKWCLFMPAATAISLLVQKMTSTSGWVYAKAFFYNFPPLKKTYDFCYLLSYLDNMQYLLPAGRWQIYCMNKHHILTTGDAHFQVLLSCQNSVRPVRIIVMYIYRYLNYWKFMALRPKNNQLFILYFMYYQLLNHLKFLLFS